MAAGRGRGNLHVGKRSFVVSGAFVVVALGLFGIGCPALAAATQRGYDRSRSASAGDCHMAEVRKDLVPSADTMSVGHPGPPASPSEAATLAPPAGVPAAGGRPTVPGFEIVEELGRGGMGAVYTARQVSLNRFVALKLILAGPYAGADQLARFRVEAESVARLQHPGIVQIHEIGSHAGHSYLALEYVPGGTLNHRCAGRPLPPDEAARLVEALARAVHYAHQRGIIHRDLKPGNVLLTEDGQPKIADFGLAKMLNAGPGDAVGRHPGHAGLHGPGAGRRQARRRRPARRRVRAGGDPVRVAHRPAALPGGQPGGRDPQGNDRGGAAAAAGRAGLPARPGGGVPEVPSEGPGPPL